MPLTIPGSDGSDMTIEDPTGFKFTDASIGGVIGALIPYTLAFAGLILFILTIWGGFQILTAAGNDEKIGKGRMAITSGVIGFAIIFFAYWIMQIVQEMFGVGLGFGN